MHLTIALAQTYPKLGDVAHNLQQHQTLIAQAAAQGAQLIIFPELSLTGYQVMDLVPELALRADATDVTFVALLDASATHNIDVVVGFVHQDARSRFAIASAYLAQGACLHVHRKVYLPTYGMFDDGRFFSAGDSVRAFDTRWGRVGMLICEDFWHMALPYLLWADGADLLLLHSASPSRGVAASEGGRLTVARWVELVGQAYGSMFTNFVAHVGRVGYEDGKNFWGGSFIVGPGGDILTQAGYLDAALHLHTIDLNELHRTRARLPLLRDERPDLVLRELQRIVAARHA